MGEEKNGERPERADTADHEKTAVAAPDQAEPEADRPVVARAPCPVIGVGASAGGFDAFREFLEHTPADCGLAFVLIQHLNPEYKSQLSELLGRFTQMPVRQVDYEMPIEPNTVFVIPENTTLTIRDGILRVAKPMQAGSQHAIDTFLLSLAEDQGENAACVILSGAGNDGTIGLPAVKEHGGLTMAQTASTAKYDSMLQSAIMTGLVDLELPVGEMPAKLIAYFRQVDRAKPPERASEVSRNLADSLTEICALLRARTGNDFSEYKECTLARRIQRRMQVLQISEVPRYVERLRRDVKEVDLLFKDLLIGVTHFFRDTEAFAALQALAVPKLFENKTVADQVRVWVAGCATGEEAYSIAILLHEHMARLGAPPKVQIFASDIDERALEVARAGRYPAAIEQDVSPERLERFFVKEDATYCIRKKLREICIFSRHNLLKDAPFSHLDLISCRNLLIYLNTDLQNRVIPVLHYALKPEGFLFLGPSENVTHHARLFHTIDKKHRLFRKCNDGLAALPKFPIVETAKDRLRPATAPAANRPSPESITQILDRILLDRYTPAYVVVNDHYQIVQSSGRTGRYLELAAGAPDVNVLGMARPGLRLDLRAAIQRAAKSGRKAVQRNITIQVNGGTQPINLVVEPILPKDWEDKLYLIVFRDIGPIRAGEEDEENYEGLFTSVEDANVQQLEAELRWAREQIQSTTEELETSNEELKSSNEELSSMNEELQSANEELETSKEELQSINEELQTVNAELSYRIEELARTNNDLKNLLQSTQIGTVFLDTELQIKNFTPAVTELFHLRDTDIGRPISHLAWRFEDPALEQDARLVLRAPSMVVEREVHVAETKSSYLMRILPYRTIDNVIDGVVVTFVDVSKLKQAESEIAQLNRNLSDRVTELETLLDIAPIGIVIAEDRACQRVRINRRASEILGRTHVAEPVAGEEFDWSALRGPEEISQEDLPLQRASRTGRAVPNEELCILRPERPPVDVMASAMPLFDGSGKVRGAIMAFDDITALKQAQRAEEARSQQQAVVAMLAARALKGTPTGQFVDEAVRAVATILGAEYCAVLELLPDGESFLLKAGAGLRSERLGTTVIGPQDETQAHYTLKLGQPVIVSDQQTERRFHETTLLQEHGAVSGISVAISGKQRPYGVLAVHTARKRQFSADDVTFLQSIANLLASTMQREAQESALIESETRYRTLLDSANDAVFVFELDEQGRPGPFREVSAVACRLLGRSRQDLLSASPAEILVPEATCFARMIADLRTEGHLIFEAALSAGQGPAIAVEASANLLRLSGRPTVLLIARDSRERRERREAQRRQKLLMAELQHRVKNLLATLHSLVMQTLKNSTSLEGFAESIGGRLRALATAHDLLLQSNFDELDLREILLAELAPYITSDTSKLTTAGPKVYLKADAAQTLGMIFHELATNASKYGAFGTPGGRAEVTWTVEDDGAGRRLVLKWIESGVRLAAPPAKRGLGFTLIEKAAPFELGATSRMELNPDGLTCIIEIPLTEKLGSLPDAESE